MVLKFSSEIYFLFLDLYKQVTTSAQERIEYPKNFLNSGMTVKYFFQKYQVQ